MLAMLKMYWPATVRTTGLPGRVETTSCFLAVRRDGSGLLREKQSVNGCVKQGSLGGNRRNVVLGAGGKDKTG